MIGSKDAVFRTIGPADNFEHRLSEWIKYNGHRPDAETTIAAYRALHRDVGLIDAGEATGITYGPMDQGYDYDEHVVSEAMRLGMIVYCELRSVPSVFEQPPLFPLSKKFTAHPHLPTLWAKYDTRTERRETHYLWNGECSQIALAFWLWCDQDAKCFDYAVRNVWQQYETYDKFDCGYPGEGAKFAAALATAADDHYQHRGVPHPRSEKQNA